MEDVGKFEKLHGVASVIWVREALSGDLHRTWSGGVMFWWESPFATPDSVPSRRVAHSSISHHPNRTCGDSHCRHVLHSGRYVLTTVCHHFLACPVVLHPHFDEIVLKALVMCWLHVPIVWPRGLESDWTASVRLGRGLFFHKRNTIVCCFV